MINYLIMKALLIAPYNNLKVDCSTEVINREDFYENMTISKGKDNDYKICLPNNCSFEYNRINRIFSSFKL